MIRGMTAIDRAIQILLDRVKTAELPIKRLAELSGASVGTIWSLRNAGGAADVNITPALLRRVESALDELDRERSAGGGADDPEHSPPPGPSRKQMAACHE